MVVLGVNGCGKSTMLKLLDGLAFASGGEVRYGGSPLDARTLGDPSFRRRFRGEVGLLFQNVDAMLFNPTVADEIAFGPRQLGLGDVDGRVARQADLLGVTALLSRPPFELSGGEKKRVALAALLACDPRVLLLDEATANLDPAWAGTARRSPGRAGGPDRRRRHPQPLGGRGAGEPRAAPRHGPSRPALRRPHGRAAPRPHAPRPQRPRPPARPHPRRNRACPFPRARRGVMCPAGRVTAPPSRLYPRAGEVAT